MRLLRALRYTFSATVLSTVAFVVPSCFSGQQVTRTATPDTTPSYTWKNVQIVAGGFVDGLYFHPKQQGLMYAKTDIGGAYRWNKAAGDTQWVPLLNFIGRFYDGFDQGVESIALDPNDPNKLYLAVGEYADSYGDNGALLISDDQGSTFTPVPLNFKLGSNDNGRNIGERLVVDPGNSRHLYLGTRLNGLQESNDGGLTWGQVASFPVTGPSSNPEDPEVGVVFEDFIASSGLAANGKTKTVYVGVSSPGTGLYSSLYVSNNGGISFNPVPGQPRGEYPNATSIDTKNGILYVTYGLNNSAGCSPYCDNAGPYGPNTGQVWSYTLPTTGNSGVWLNITPPETTPNGGAYGFGSVVVDPNHPNVVMVTTLNKYYPPPYDDVFRSLDFGATWFNIGTNVNRSNKLSPWIDFGNNYPDGGNWLNHLVVDPFNSNHVMYGDGQTIWQTYNISDADGVPTNTKVVEHGNATNWTIGALGIEETDVLSLVSPPSGPAHLISEMGDLGGFTHTELNTSPVTGQQMTPRFTTGTSVDFAQSNPMIVARVGSPAYGLTSSGGYSLDGGIAWQPFATQPAGVVNGEGTVAISADGRTFMWISSDVGMQPSWSNDRGVTWTASTGVPAQINNYTQLTVLSDRINPKKFYIFDPQYGPNGQTPLYISTDGGKSFTQASVPTDYDISLAVSPAAEGDLWLTSYNGLFHSTDSGKTFNAVNGIQPSYEIAFGAAAAGATYPAIYLVGQQSSDTACSQNNPTTNAEITQYLTTLQSECVYRSTDGGATFVHINSFNDQFGYSNTIAGDPRVFGRIYIGTAGRGIIEGDSSN